jgi:two-component system, OmpR family, response regulator RegX3
MSYACQPPPLDDTHRLPLRFGRLALKVGIHTAAGGGTRILIIDDDYKPPPQVPPYNEAGSEPADAPEVAAEAQVPASGSDSSTRPVVHEIQLPTHFEVEPDTNHAERDDLEAGQPDAAVVRELLARVEELLSRTRGMPGGGSPGWGGTVRFGKVLIEPSTQTVVRDGRPVRVTGTEFRLLLALMRRHGAIASRAELLREVWGAGTVISRRAVDTHIARLRRKLEADPANPRHILTALAWGYRFRP